MAPVAVATAAKAPPDFLNSGLEDRTPEKASEPQAAGTVPAESKTGSAVSNLVAGFPLKRDTVARIEALGVTLDALEVEYHKRRAAKPPKAPPDRNIKKPDGYFYDLACQMVGKLTAKQIVAEAERKRRMAQIERLKANGIPDADGIVAKLTMKGVKGQQLTEAVSGEIQAFYARSLNGKDHPHG
jgi:hypothetical protein